MSLQTVITTEILIQPRHLHIHEEVIRKELYKLEGKNYSIEVGYISKILDILNIQTLNVITTDFSGNILFKVSFLVENYNINIGDILDCNIIQSSNITLATSNPYKIIIINEPNLPELNKNDNVKIKVLCKEINKDKNFIKIVGKFFSINN